MFNEEENIEHALACAVAALELYGGDYEIVIVDDASTDRSPEIVAPAGGGRSAHPDAAPRGQPQARRLAQDRLRGGPKDLVLYMDADLPFDPDVHRPGHPRPWRSRGPT